MYEIGFILNRASSIIIGPILTKAKIWPKYQYDKDVSEISKDNPKFQSMITDLVLMRSHILMYLILGLFSVFSSYKWFVLVCLVFIIIFVFAGKKHSKKINIIRKATETEQEKNLILRANKFSTLKLNPFTCRQLSKNLVGSCYCP